MLPPSNIDSSLLQRSIEQWEELLTCHQCHRIVESIARLWEGENQQSLCSHCCPKLARSIFDCINQPTMDADNPHASDPGRVVQLLKWLLAAYQHQELLQESTTRACSSSAIHDKHTSKGNVRSTLYQTTGERTNLTTARHQVENNEHATKNDADVGAIEKLSGSASPLNNIPLSQDCTHTPYSYQERLDLPDSHIQCSIPILHSFECQHTNSALTTATQSTQHHSQKNLFLSLPETDDFDRIFPGPILTTQTSHQSQTEMHQPDDCSTSEPLFSVQESSESSQQLMPHKRSGNLTQFEECQLSSNSRLPETADFDSILSKHGQRPYDDQNLTSSSNESPLEESELPATEDFDRIYPMRQQKDSFTTEITTTKDDVIPKRVPGPTVVSPVDDATATKLRERLEDPVPNHAHDSRPIFTPMARKRRNHDRHIDAFTKPTKNPKNGDSSECQDNYSLSIAPSIIRKTFPCQVRRHPFHKSKSELETINICARTFQYVLARANGWCIEGERGETIWGDTEVYAQTMAQLSAPLSHVDSWIRKSPWWGTTHQSPCPRIPPTRDGSNFQVKTKLLHGYRILLISRQDWDKESIPVFDFTALHDMHENDYTRNLTLDFKSFHLDEMKCLCQAAGAEILESIVVDMPINVTDKLLILVAEEIDDEIFQERLLPRLVERCVLLPNCKFSQINISTKALPVDDATIPIVYFSWLLQSISTGIVAPVSPYGLGMLHL